MSRKAVKGEYIETDTGNKVARKAILIGTQHIMLGGRTVIQAEAMIRGDLYRTAQSQQQPPPSSSSSSSAAGGGGGGGGGGSAPAPQSAAAAAAAPISNTAIAIGRYCFLSRGCCLRPPGRIYKGAFTYLPLRLGDQVFVGEGSVVQAATVGSHVHIGAGVVIGEFAIIKDYVRVLDGAVVPANAVIPSFSIVAGRPARVVGEVPEGGHEAFQLKDLYRTVGNNPQPLPV